MSAREQLIKARLGMLALADEHTQAVHLARFLPAGSSKPPEASRLFS